MQGGRDVQVYCFSTFGAEEFAGEDGAEGQCSVGHVGRLYAVDGDECRVRSRGQCRWRESEGFNGDSTT